MTKDWMTYLINADHFDVENMVEPGGYYAKYYRLFLGWNVCWGTTINSSLMPLYSIPIITLTTI